MHFIRLGLSDEKGKEVASTFYWRSNAAYEGKEILTGPTSSGFESLNDMPTARLQTKYKTKEVDGRYYIEVSLRILLPGLLSLRIFNFWIKRASLFALRSIRIIFSRCCQVKRSRYLLIHLWIKLQKASFH